MISYYVSVIYFYTNLFSEMAQASLRLGRSVTNQALKRHFCASSAVNGKHVNYSVQDGVATIR